MAFESLSERLQNALKMFRGNGKLTEEDLKAPMREVRMALLEADVNFKVVKDFVAKVKERAVGEAIGEGLNPHQQIIKIVNEELIELLGGTQSKLTVAPKPPTVIMLVGLQGAGKTTTAGKLANYLKRKHKKPLLVAGDVYRPAAITQLQVLGEQLNVPVFTLGVKVSPVEIAKKAMEKAHSLACDTVIIDTAGRLHNKANLMNELEKIHRIIKREIPEAPHETFLVLDATTGQNAINQAKVFMETAKVTGVVLTKLDGTAKGGVVVAIKEELGLPVKWIGVGEGIMDFRPFEPDKFVEALFDSGK